MSSLALELLRKIIRNQFKAFILFYDSNFNGSCTIMIQRITTFRNVIQKINIIWFTDCRNAMKCRSAARLL